MENEHLPVSPAADRNKSFIFGELQKRIPRSATLLELASGTGQHAEYFASQAPEWTIIPSDREIESMGLLQRINLSSLDNLMEPLLIDAFEELPEPLTNIDHIYTANSFHIMPWEGVTLFFEKANRILQKGGCFFVYGPFDFEDIELAESNRSFSQSLKSRDPSMGLRHFNDVLAEAKRNDMSFIDRVVMPANNFLLVFER